MRITKQSRNKVLQRVLKYSCHRVSVEDLQCWLRGMMDMVLSCEIFANLFLLLIGPVQSFMKGDLKGAKFHQ